MLKNVIRVALLMVFKTLFKLKVSGDIPHLAGGRTLVIANHESLLDGVLLGTLLPDNPVFVVNTEMAKKPLFKAVLSLVDYLAVDPTNPLVMKSLVKLIESGRPVVIFPEGRITTTGSLMKVYDGTAFVATKAGATIIPIHLSGLSYSTLSRTSGKHPRRYFPQVTVTVTSPASIPPVQEGSAKQRRRLAGEALRKIMQNTGLAANEPTTLYSAFVNAAERNGPKRKVLEDMKLVELSYEELLRMATGLARASSKHTSDTEAVGVLLPNLSATVALTLGLSASGRIPAMLNYTAGEEGLSAACTAANVNTIITSRKFVAVAKLGAILDRMPQRKILWLEDMVAELSIWDKLWVVSHKFRPAALCSGASPDDPAIILFTSGSEGKPKGVVLSHRALLANVNQIRAVVDITPNDKFLNALPMFHSFGLTGGTLLPLLSGASVFMYPSPLHYRVIPELAYDRSCTVLLGTSTFLANYARFAHPYDFYRMRYVIAGAEKLADAVRNTWFEKFGLRIMEGYGATETAPVIAVNTPMAYKTGSVGQLLPGMEARLRSIPGIDVGGLLHVRGPNLMSGYLRYENPGELEPPSSEEGYGWYNTGDIVDIDSEGFLHIKGRVKRFAKIAGEMISLEVVEKLVKTAYPEGQHAATSVPDAQRGERLVLFSTLPSIAREPLQTAAKSLGVPELAIPRDIRNVGALPLLGTGKLDYVALNKQALANV